MGCFLLFFLALKLVFIGVGLKTQNSAKIQRAVELRHMLYVRFKTVTPESMKNRNSLIAPFIFVFE